MAGSAGPDLVQNGLVFAVDAADKNSYPGSGATWYDISGKGYNVTLYNSPTYLIRGFLQFRSASTTSQYGTANFNEGVLKQSNQTGQWTIETVFKYISAPSSIEAVVAGRSGCHGGIYLWTEPAIYQAIKTDQCWTGAVNTYVNALTANTIYHSVMTYNNGTVKHYLNGTSPVSNSTLNLSTYNMYSYGDTFYIGGIPSGGPPQAYATNTDIAIIRAYNKELSASEILQNYNSTKSRFGL